MSFRRLAILTALALVACASTHYTLDLPRDQVAEVYGLDDHPTIGVGHALVFAAVDGKGFSSGMFASLPMNLDVLPGKHVLRCYYATTFDGLQGPSGTVDVQIDARAGAIYQARCEFGARGEMLVRFKELSAEQVETVRAKEKKAAADAAETGS